MGILDYAKMGILGMILFFSNGFSNLRPESILEDEPKKEKKELPFKINSPSELKVNFEKKGQNLNPMFLKSLGYDAIPGFDFNGNSFSYNYHYEDFQKKSLDKEHKDINYFFQRKFYFNLNVGGKTLEVPVETKVVVGDFTPPSFTLSNKTHFFSNSSFDTSITKIPEFWDNSSLQVKFDFDYKVLSSDDSKNVYRVEWKFEDEFKNDTTAYQDFVFFKSEEGKLENKVKKLELNLEQNFPNPFNPSTKIKYSVDFSEKVTFSVYDVNGREIKKLECDNPRIGENYFDLNLQNLPSGVYLGKIESKGITKFVKMNFVK